MKKMYMRLLAVLMGAFTAAVPFTVPVSAEYRETIDSPAALPAQTELQKIGCGTVVNGRAANYQVILPLERYYTALYVVFDQTTGFDKVSFDCTASGYPGGNTDADDMTLSETKVNLVNFQNYPEIPEAKRFYALRLFDADDVRNVELTDFQYENPASENCLFRYAVYGWSPSVPMKKVYTGRYGSGGEMLDAVGTPGTRPDCQLAFSAYPQITYTVGDTLDVTKLPVHLVAETSSYTRYYDVRDYVYTEDSVNLDTVGTRMIHLKSRFRAADGSGRGNLTLEYPIEVLASAAETTPTMPVLPVIPVQNETTPTKAVTTAYEDPNYSPWFTDANGNQIYKGTNACLGYHLEIVTPGQKEFAVGEAFTTAGIKVFLVEDRTHNDCYYDVTDALIVNTDYNPNEPGVYTVSVFSEYEGSEGKATEPVTYQVEVKECMTTSPQETVTETTFTETTVYETVNTCGSVTTAYEDPNYSPWFTDAEGHTYNRGTNACLGYHLEIITPGQKEFAVGEAFTTAGIKVFLVEDRTHNDCYYDVTDALIVNTDYNPDVPGKYTVSVFTEYAGREGKAKEPVTYEVEVTERMTTGPDGNKTETRTTETTAKIIGETTASQETGSQTMYGDVNLDKQVTVSDAILTARVIAEDSTVTITEQGMRNADMNRNGTPDAEDTILILRQLAGIA